ncbi:5'-nucleotidase, lipoprotein e(P4) family [Sphingomonas baiyangensis]|uniref:Acid phosphatase n=1 Tax=Sphingomonas baiyangensis TaxID=2572576 RepID=A0A4U1L2M8_9SPHN|nr:HAD family acid phosphatase [Sphingomonas baiyangensis]TKD50285.1 acid phosphatase [Sphingomonas baiyangensis]
MLLTAALLGGCATTAPPAAYTAAPEQPGRQYRWLLGSGEAAAMSRQTHAAMAAYAVARARGPADSAVLAAGASPDAPRWGACDSKPRAVVYDIDETVLFNTGANYDSASRDDPPFDPARWARWEQGGAKLVEPVPGVVEAIAAIRAAGVTVIFNSNRDNVYAAQTADALASVGITGAVAGETLFLKGDVAPGSAKDPRRAAIAARYCVVAMAGDNLGDFADAFNDKALTVQQRRALAQAPALRAKWGAGWFLLPNSLYGAWEGAGFDDLFPADKRWTLEEND